MTTESDRQDVRTARRAVLLDLGMNVAAPIALFYGLRAAGVGPWWALLIGMVPPAVRAVYTVVERRRIDAMAVLAITIMLLSVALSSLTGSPRVLLAKDGWLTAVVGIWFLVSMFGTPFYFQIVRAISGGALLGRAETAWRRSAEFRRVIYGANTAWGVGLLVDAVVRVLLAYVLPIDTVPLVSGLQLVVVIVGLEAGTRVYVRRRGVPAARAVLPQPQGAV